MPMSSEFRIDVLNNFISLREALNKVWERLCVLDAHLPVWFDTPSYFAFDNKTDREKIFEFISQIEYLEQQKPKEILIGAGIVAASPETLETVRDLNACKDRFKASILALKSAKIPLSDHYLTEHFEIILSKRPKDVADTLGKIGLSRLHLKQCYRRIPCLSERPNKVSWTWANTRAITRISVHEAEKLLLKQGTDPGIILQLNKLAHLNYDEPLAIVQTLAPHLRANLVFNEGTTIKRRMVKGPVPLFYLGTKGELLPELRPPSQKQGRNEKRHVRSDVRLDPEPFLPAIRAHRYLQYC